MRGRSIIVVGAGAAGLSAALVLARDGHRVVLLERDDMVCGEPGAAPGWERRGIPHFHQPHAFIPRGRKEMRIAFADVFQALLDAGAWDLDLRPKLRGPQTPDDEDLAYFAARRPLIEWALRRAVIAEPAVQIRALVHVTGLIGSRADRPRIGGVATSEGPVEGDLVVDAMGRRSPMPGWVEELGGRPWAVRSSDCGIIYYSRYYHARDGVTLPDGPWLPTPRADLGYGLFRAFQATTAPSRRSSPSRRPITR